MGKIIAISNQKGGVGKTTTSVNLACSLASFGKKVCLIDIDYQANATTNLGVNRANLKSSSADIFTNNKKAEEIIIQIERLSIDLIPAKFDLSIVEEKLLLNDDKNYVLSNALEGVRDNYDYLIIDCPPSLGLMTTNALIAADSVLIPVQCEFLAMDGLTQLLNSIRFIQKKQKINNRDLVIEGVLLTMLDTRSNIGYEIISEVKTYFREKVFKTIIPRNVKVAVSSSYGLPVTEYSPKSKGSQSYRNLAKEVIENNEEN